MKGGKMKKIKIKAYPTRVGIESRKTKEQYYSILLNRAGIDALNNFFEVSELMLKKVKGGE